MTSHSRHAPPLPPSILAAPALQQHDPQKCPGGGQQRPVQRVLRRQRPDTAVEAGHALLAADGVKAVGEAVVLRVDGQHQLVGVHAVRGVDDGARALQAEAVQRRLQGEERHVGHQRTRPHRRQLGEVGVQRVARVGCRCCGGPRPPLPAPLVQPQRHPLDRYGDGVAQDGVQCSGKQQRAERQQAAAVRRTHAQEAGQTLADAVQQTRRRVVADDLALQRERGREKRKGVKQRERSISIVTASLALLLFQSVMFFYCITCKKKNSISASFQM